MICRDNYHDVQRYLQYMGDVLRRDPLTVKVHRARIRQLLVWADAVPFPRADGIRPTFPAYLVKEGIRQDGLAGELAPDTIEGICAVARLFFRWARIENPRRYKRLGLHWIESLRPGRQAGTVPGREVFDLESVRAVVAGPSDKLVHQRDMAAVAFLFLSGMRAGSFVTLPLQSVDVDARTVKQWPSLGVRTKYRKAATTYLLNIPDLVAVVKEWDRVIRAQLKPTDLWYPPFDHRGTVIVAGHRRGKISSHTNLLGLSIKAACERAGVPPLSPHKLRHGHAVYGLTRAQTLADLKAVSQNLMHASLSTTDGIYGVLTQEETETRIANLGAATPAIDGELPTEIATIVARVLAELEQR